MLRRHSCFAAFFLGCLLFVSTGFNGCEGEDSSSAQLTAAVSDSAIGPDPEEAEKKAERDRRECETIKKWAETDTCDLDDIHKAHAAIAARGLGETAIGLGMGVTAMRAGSRTFRLKGCPDCQRPGEGSRPGNGLDKNLRTSTCGFCRGRQSTPTGEMCQRCDGEGREIRPCSTCKGNGRVPDYDAPPQQ